MLDDALDLERVAPALDRARRALLAAIAALPPDRPDLWLAMALEQAARHEAAPWIAVIALHLAADAYPDPRVARALDEASVQVVARALEAPATDPVERTLLRKSLASAHLSVAEESVRLGDRAAADAHLRAAIASLEALAPSVYRTTVERGIQRLERHLRSTTTTHRGAPGCD